VVIALIPHYIREFFRRTSAHRSLKMEVQEQRHNKHLVSVGSKHPENSLGQ